MQLTELTTLYTLTTDIIIMVKTEDIKKEDVTAVKVVRSTHEYHITKLELFLKFGAFEPEDIHSRIDQKFYRNLVYRSLSDETLKRMLKEMGGEKEESEDKVIKKGFEEWLS